MSFLEVSAKRGTNVREAFMSVATRAVGEHIARAHLGSGRGRITVRRTMQRVPGLQVKIENQSCHSGCCWKREV